MNEDRQKLLDDSVRAEKKAAREREWLVREAEREKQEIRNRGVLPRSVSIGQQKAMEIQRVNERLELDLREHDEVEAERKKRTAEALRSLENAEAARNQAATAQREASDKITPIPWLGTDRDFADAIFKLFRKKLIPGKDWFDALKSTTDHFVDADGEKFNPENLRENIRNRQNEGKGGPGEGLKLDE